MAYQYKKNNRRYHKEYDWMDMKEFGELVESWNGKIEVVNMRARLMYVDTWLGFSYKWIIMPSIDFYDSEDYRYDSAYAWGPGGFFSSAPKKQLKQLEKLGYRPEGAYRYFHRDTYLKGGTQTACAVLVYKDCVQ